MSENTSTQGILDERKRQNWPNFHIENEGKLHLNFD